jgi:hypothetical protein
MQFYVGSGTNGFTLSNAGTISQASGQTANNDTSVALMTTGYDADGIKPNLVMNWVGSNNAYYGVSSTNSGSHSWGVRNQTSGACSEVMSLNSSGKLTLSGGLSCTAISAFSDTVHNIERSGVGSPVLNLNRSGDSKSVGDIWLNFQSSGSSSGDISTNASNVMTLTNSSDVRVKKNINYSPAFGLETILALKPCEYDWKDDSAKNVKGFIAQDVKTVIPECVAITDQLESGGLADMHSLEMQTMIPVLVRAMQQQQVLIDSLCVRITELESNNVQAGRIVLATGI